MVNCQIKIVSVAFMPHKLHLTLIKEAFTISWVVNFVVKNGIYIWYKFCITILLVLCILLIFDNTKTL